VRLAVRHLIAFNSGTATRGRGRGRGGRKTNDRTPKTAADLDAEMEVIISLLIDPIVY
jgi:hypothetical protein